MKKLKFLFTLLLSKVLMILCDTFAKGRGTNLPGAKANAIMPDFISMFEDIDYDKVVFITGTNGKSTSTNMIYHTLLSAGLSVASNTEGANMMGGVATTLIRNSTLSGRFNKEFLILEIDERSLPLIRKQLPGRRMGLTNLQKDQVQRNGDPDFILRKFRSAVGNDMKLYLNNEEPRSKSLEDIAGSVCYYSVSENSRTYQIDDFYAVTLPCPKCSHPIAYENYNLASIGKFSCSHCDHKSNPTPDVPISNINFENNTFEYNNHIWNVPYNNPFYIYNFAMCIAICSDLGLSDSQIQAAFACFKNPASHEDIVHYKGKEIHYLRGKQENPEALQSELDIIAADPRKKAVFVGMYQVADFYPYYGGSFYFFDCNFAPIVKSGVEKYIAFSATVANDIASRMILSGAEESDVCIFDTDDIPTVFSVLDQIETDVVYILTNTKHAPMIKAFFAKGDRTDA